ncbi:PucR family transcriptional regulator [Streptomyces sp. CA2R106]|uniref:PucR family transcriptional regulator n=1 Tax=Streptomyces sp. CA2R106 TaxID=3120153 RepID=UPI00300B64D0
MTVDNLPKTFLTGYAEILLKASATGRRLTREELRRHRALGAQAAEAGCDWRQILREHLAAGRVVRPRSAADLDGVLATVGQALDAFADGYQRAQRAAAHRHDAARREFIDGLLSGAFDPEQLAAGAERFGLQLSYAHGTAVAVGPEAYGDGHPVVRQVGAETLGRFGNRGVLLAAVDGALVCVAPGGQDEVLAHFADRAVAAGALRVAVGRAQPGAAGCARSYREALGVLSVAERMEFEERVLHAADLLVFPVLTRDRQALADLVRTLLGPLEQARGGARPLLRTLEVYFDAGCVTAEAARRLSLSVRALSYRLHRVRLLTGADPADPRHRYALQTAVIGARLLDWPREEP